jgi:glutathione S-transferase
MHRLYHFWLCPFSRKVRLVLSEKDVQVEPHVEKVWERRQAFLNMNPAGEVPVLALSSGPALADSRAITEYLDEVHPEPPLFGQTPVARAEARRLVAWFDEKFFAEVGVYLIYEKITKRLLAHGEPDSHSVRAGHANIHQHLKYLTWLTESRRWLAGDNFSIADITAAAHLSCVDYLGDVPWAEFPEAKDWYARIKSRPSFREILGDHIPGYPPPPHYADLDF